jgi:hypothetical protein
MFGTERLLRECERVRKKSVDEIADHLMASAASFCPRPRDDVAVVVFRCRLSAGASKPVGAPAS